MSLPGEDMGDDTSSDEEGADVADLRKRVKEQRCGHKQHETAQFD
jgi:hypothetical protein